MVAGRKSDTDSLFDTAIGTFETMPEPMIKKTPVVS